MREQFLGAKASRRKHLKKLNSIYKKDPINIFINHASKHHLCWDGSISAEVCQWHLWDPLKCSKCGKLRHSLSFWWQFDLATPHSGKARVSQDTKRERLLRADDFPCIPRSPYLGSQHIASLFILPRALLHHLIHVRKLYDPNKQQFSLTSQNKK